MLNFTAIDFETATGKFDSACSVAVVEIEAGKTADEWYSLLKPPGLCFCRGNIRIHGITPAMVKDAPDFGDIWEELGARLENRIVVAHNASFDMRVLKACLESRRISLPRFRYCCTVSMSRKVWPELCNHRLETVGSFLNYSFNHHNALDDARACAIIPITAAKMLGSDSFEEVAAHFKLAIKNFSD